MTQKTKVMRNFLKKSNNGSEDQNQLKKNWLRRPKWLIKLKMNQKTKIAGKHGSEDQTDSED